MTTLLMVDIDPARAQELTDQLCSAGINVEYHRQNQNYDCVVSSPAAYFACLNPTSEYHHKPVVLLTDRGNFPETVRAIQRGASDYLVEPISTPQLQTAIENAIGVPGSEPPKRSQLIGECTKMRSLMEQIDRIALSDASVLVSGESGTGKEMVAHALHLRSDRSIQPFISLNCAAVPGELVELELFGAAASATREAEPCSGLLEDAQGGTLFLDEIGELPLEVQARLLQILNAEKSAPFVTFQDPYLDIRLIAATQRDLKQLIQEGKFREDLFYRLNVFSLAIPPLRQRDKDILLLAQSSLERLSDKLCKNGLKFSTRAKSALRHYAWPGNVRELENAVERAVILCDSDTIEVRHLSIDVSPPEAKLQKSSAPVDQTSLEDYFVQFVLQHQDQLTETEIADKLGISRKSLWERRQRLNIPRRKTRKRGLRRDTK